MRNYTDTLNDRWFLSIAVFIVAGFLVFLVQRTSPPEVEKGSTIALLIPRFEDDEGRQFERLFTQQIQAAMQTFRQKQSWFQSTLTCGIAPRLL
jgi:hypothetical protein